MNTDWLLEKWETCYAAIKTKDIVKLFSDVYFPVYGALEVDRVFQPRKECTI